MSVKRRSLALLVAAAVTVPLGLVAVPAEAHSQKRVVGYYTQWSGYDRNFLVSDLVKNGSAAKLTHLNYAFGFLDEQGKCISSDPWADYQRPFTAEQSVNGKADVAGQPLSGNLNQLKQLKQKYPKLRISISLGGWTGSSISGCRSPRQPRRACEVVPGHVAQGQPAGRSGRCRQGCLRRYRPGLGMACQ